MRTVTAREANQHFAALLRDASAGERVVITRRGKPVAVLSAYAAPETDDARQAAIAKMIETTSEGLFDGGGRSFSRDEMHER